MQHEEKKSKAAPSPAAHNHSSSGISKPAVQPLQRAGIEEQDPLQMNAGPDRQDIKYKCDIDPYKQGCERQMDYQKHYHWIKETT